MMCTMMDGSLAWRVAAKKIDLVANMNLTDGKWQERNQWRIGR